MKCTCLTFVSFDLVLKPGDLQFWGVCRGLLQSLFLQMKNRGVREVKPVSEASRWVRLWNPGFLLVQLPPDPSFPPRNAFTCPQYPWGFLRKMETVPYTKQVCFWLQDCVGVRKQKFLKASPACASSQTSVFRVVSQQEARRCTVRAGKRCLIKRHSWKLVF